jgi:hypothetical protein
MLFLPEHFEGSLVREGYKYRLWLLPVTRKTSGPVTNMQYEPLFSLGRDCRCDERAALWTAREGRITDGQGVFLHATIS